MLKSYPVELRGHIVAHLSSQLLATYIDFQDGLDSIVKHWPPQCAVHVILRVLKESVNINLKPQLQTFFKSCIDYTLRKCFNEREKIYFCFGHLGIDFALPQDFFKLVQSKNSLEMKQFLDPIIAFCTLPQLMMEHVKPYTLPQIPIELKAFIACHQTQFTVPPSELTTRLRQIDSQDAHVKPYWCETDQEKSLCDLIPAGRACLNGRSQLCLTLLAIYWLKPSSKPTCVRVIFQTYLWLTICMSKLYIRFDLILHSLDKMESYMSCPFDYTIALITRQIVFKNYGCMDNENKIFNYLMSESTIPPQSIYFQQYWLNHIQTIFESTENQILELTLDRKFHLLCAHHCSETEVAEKLQKIKLDLFFLQSQIYKSLSEIGHLPVLKSFFREQLMYLEMYMAILKMFDVYNPLNLCETFEGVYFNFLAFTLFAPEKFAKLLQKLIFTITRQPSTSNYNEVDTKFEAYFNELDQRADLLHCFATCRKRFTYLTLLSALGDLNNVTIIRCIDAFKISTDSKHYRLKLLGSLLAFNLSTANRHKYLPYDQQEEASSKYLCLAKKRSLDFIEHCTTQNTPLESYPSVGHQILHYIKADPKILTASLAFGIETATNQPRI